MKRFKFALVIALLCVCKLAFAQETNENPQSSNEQELERIKLAIDFIKQACIRGEDIEVLEEQDDNITLYKKGIEGEVSFKDRLEFIINMGKETRAVHNDKIRECMNRPVARIIHLSGGLVGASLSLPEAPPLYPVWYGTNRQPVDPMDSSRGYTSDHDSNTHYGICHVSIPESHTFGSIGSEWWRRFLNSTDDRLKIFKISQLDESSFWQNIRTELNKLNSDERIILFYIHGYNVSFEDAVLRAAQIGFDLKVPGITALFSWPSKGTLTGYAADSESIQVSERDIVEFLIRLAQDTQAQRVHIIAHSMGNRGLLRAIQRITQQTENRSSIKFGQIFLAAPDINTALFEEVAHLYPRISERTTLYVSPKDKALGLSYWIHNYPRIGFTPPLTIIKGIDTVEVKNIDLTMLGHGYFAEAAAILYDMYTLIRNNISPQNRARLMHKKTAENLSYWTFER